MIHFNVLKRQRPISKSIYICCLVLVAIVWGYPDFVMGQTCICKPGDSHNHKVKPNNVKNRKKTTTPRKNKYRKRNKKSREYCPSTIPRLIHNPIVRPEYAAVYCFKILPNDERVFMNVAPALSAKGNHGRALFWTDKAIHLYPKNLDFAVMKVRILFWSGDLETAWREARKLDPSVMHDHENSTLIANLAFWREDWEEAVRLYNFLLQLWPDDRKARYNRGVAYQNLARYEEAYDDFQALCELDPGNTPGCLAVDKLQFVQERNAWNVRNLAFTGEYDKAWEGALKLNLANQDNALLIANIAFWKKDWEEAIARYTSFLERWPKHEQALRNRGISYKQLHKSPEALADFLALCNLHPEDEKSCALYKQTKAEQSTIRFLVAGGMSSDGGKLLGLVDWSPATRAHLGLEVDFLSRESETELLFDLFIQAFGSYSWTNGLSVYGAFGRTFESDFSPSWTAQIEGGYASELGFQILLKYWRIQFEKGGTNVLSPAIVVYIKRFIIYLRYYLGLEDDRDPSNAVIGKIGYAIVDSVIISLGAGFGDRTEYLQISNQELDFYWLIIAGLEWKIDWNHTLRFTYIYRDETVDDDYLIRHEFLLSYELKL